MSRPLTRPRSWIQAESDDEPRMESEPLWYACYTRAHHEKRVARVLQDRQVERFLPLVGHRRQWHDRVKLVEFPLFPGYLFVRISTAQFFDVTCVPGVVNIVSVNGYPVRIDAAEIENVRRFAAALTQHGMVPEPEDFIEGGARVRITSGPFKGVEGVVEESRGSGRVVVGLMELGQAFALNVPRGHLELI